MRHSTSRMRKLGLSTRMVITTTPAPTPLFRTILEDKDGLVLARSSTFDNAQNLDKKYVAQARRIAATPHGRREFMGELTFAMDANIFKKVDWAAHRIRSLDELPAREDKPLFDRIYVSVDPATGEKKSSDLHGIVVMGVREEADGFDHVFILADLSMQSPSPTDWAKVAVDAYNAWIPFAPRSGPMSSLRPTRAATWSSRPCSRSRRSSSGRCVPGIPRPSAPLSLRPGRSRTGPHGRGPPGAGEAAREVHGSGRWTRPRRPG
ncbi:hypothetical protein ACN28S_29925 [Cystobacter fuscus]